MGSAASDLTEAPGDRAAGSPRACLLSEALTIQTIRHLGYLGAPKVAVVSPSADDADQDCDRVALMHRGRIRALGTPAERAAQDVPPTLEDVFRDVAGSGLDDEAGDFRDVRSARRTARRVG